MSLDRHATHLVIGDRDLLEDERLIVWMRGYGVEVVPPADFKV